MDSTNNIENIRGLAKQATLKWKHDHIIVKQTNGYNFIIADGKTKGVERISYKELSKVKVITKKANKKAKPQMDEIIEDSGNHKS